MFKRLKTLWLRGDLLGIGGIVAIAIALFYFAQSFVYNLVAPAIAVFIGDPRFELNAFVIDATEFRFGLVIEAALTLAFTAVVVLLASRWVRGKEHAPHKGVTACPECTWSIPLEAKRCPYCTALIECSENED